jgi:glycosyltransferase involved in cell wall biosynthesis
LTGRRLDIDFVTSPAAGRIDLTMSNPALTVGLPVYNGERFLSESLDSILGQTLEHFRLVISDNGSIDATETICRDYARRDARIDYVRYEVNRGAAWNYNNVFRLCETPFFRWAASDDLFVPTCFERSAEVMAEAHEGVALCYAQTTIIDGAGEIIGPYDDGFDLRAPAPHARIGRIVRYMVQGNPTFGLVRAKALRATRGHGSFPGADWVLMMEIALQGEVWEIPERLFLRRRHEAISRTPTTTLAEYSRFLDPAAKPVKHERLRLLREYLAAVRHADLTPLERAQCYAAVSAAWSRRYGSIKRPLRRLEMASRRLVERA